MPSFYIVQKKLKKWARRYLPAEISGTMLALVGAWTALQATGSLAVAAIAGVAAENIGYYGVIGTSEVRRQWRRLAGRRGRVRLTAVRTLRTMGLEFGAAELLDSFLVRPGLFYVLPLMVPGHTALAYLLAKLGADLVFYGWAITVYEYMQRSALRSPTVMPAIENSVPSAE